MPSNPSEQDKYSLDDMLDRLQPQPADNEEAGELVTRADGSQAIKVRKRKRRSTQPHKEAAKQAVRFRVFQIAAAVTILILLGLSCGGLIVYANSAPYRASLVSKASAATGAKTELYQARANPTGSNFAQISLNWPEGNALKSMTLGDVKAKGLIIGSIGKRWSADEVNVAVGSIHLGIPLAGQPKRSEPSPVGISPVSFDRLGVSKLDITLGETTSPVLQLSQTEGSFYPDGPSGKPTVRLFRGDVKIPHWPAFRLDRALLEFEDGKPELISCRILHETESQGTLDLSGKFDPYALDKTQSLAVKMDSFSLSGVAGPYLGHLVSGRISSRELAGSNQLTFSSQTSNGKLVVAFTSSSAMPLKLNGFPFLGALAEKMDNTWFLEPVFDDASNGVLERADSAVRLTDLALVSRSHLKVAGTLTLAANNVLEGTLQVGVPEADFLIVKDEKVKALFAEKRDGFRFVELKISGTGNRPIDNFRDLYEGTAATDGSKGSESLFDKLTNPQGN